MSLVIRPWSVVRGQLASVSWPWSVGRILVSFGAQSFPRKRESTRQTFGNALSTDWIPAFAGMTAFTGPHGKSTSPNDISTVVRCLWSRHGGSVASWRRSVEKTGLAQLRILTRRFPWVSSRDCGTNDLRPLRGRPADATLTRPWYQVSRQS